MHGDVQVPPDYGERLPASPGDPRGAGLLPEAPEVPPPHAPPGGKQRGGEASHVNTYIGIPKENRQCLLVTVGVLRY